MIADSRCRCPSTVDLRDARRAGRDRDRFTAWTADATHALARDLAPPTCERSADAAATALAGYFNGADRRATQRLGGDLLSELIRAEEAGDRLYAAS